jgi:protein-L-isoaspartate(D-aspartate) O-methyltransferase
MEFDRARAKMLRRQLRPRGIDDPRLLDAMALVPRHLFVPKELRREAYIDSPLPLGPDQTISQPYIVALMTQRAEIHSGDRVLEIGTGSGYQAALLTEMGAEVYSIERDTRLSKQAAKNLIATGYGDVQLRAGDGREGWPEAAPFDAILVTAAPREVPPALLAQLAEGGRLVIPVGEEVQDLVLIRKVDGEMHEERIIPVRFVPLK